MEDALKAFHDKRYGDAENFLAKVLQTSPNNDKALELMGDIHGIRGEWSAALACYDKLRKNLPNRANYHYKYGGVLGMIAKSSNKVKALRLIDDVRDSFLKAIELDPRHVDARWALVELYLQLPGIVGGSEKKATRYANELAGISPVDGLLAKGRIAEYFKRFSQAESYYQAAVRVGKSKVCYQKLADLYKHQMKRPDKAKEVMDEYNKLKRS